MIPELREYSTELHLTYIPSIPLNITYCLQSNMEDRYKNLCKLVKSHALVAFGLTVFERIPDSSVPEVQEQLKTRYAAHNFSFLLSCQVSTAYTDRILPSQFLK